MKKLFVLLTFCFTLSVYSFSQGVYFDIGLGLGSATTSLDGIELTDSSLNEIGLDLGFKIGFGPIADMPLYLALAVEGIGHRLYDDNNYIQFNSYLVGPSFIVYPSSMIQIAGSLGTSFVANSSNVYTDMYDSESGFAGDLSLAIDLGKRKTGLLLGIRYFYSVNTLEFSNVEQNSSLFSFFARYAFRHK